MRLLRTLSTLFVALAARAAHACTVCDSPNGQHLRAGLFDGHFLHTLSVVLAPVPVFLGLVLLLHFGMPDLAEEHTPAQSIPAEEGNLPLAVVAA